MVTPEHSYDLLISAAIKMETDLYFQVVIKGILLHIFLTSDHYKIHNSNSEVKHESILLSGFQR